MYCSSYSSRKNYPIKFSSTIEFVSPGIFKNVIRDQRHFSGVETDLPEGFTRTIISCASGGIKETSTKQTKPILFHLGYWEDKELRELRAKIQELKLHNSQLRAFLLGGDRSSLDSETFAHKIYSIFEEHNIPVTVLWGHDHLFSVSNVSYSNLHDKWTVFTYSPFEQKPAKYVHSPIDLQKAFQVILIADGDQIILPNQAVLLPEHIRKEWAA